MAEIGESSYRRFLMGQEDALEDFVAAYSDALVRFVYGFVRNSTVAEDLAAEAVAAFLMKKRRFPDEPRLRGYLYKIARNKAMNHLRRHKESVPLEDVENVLGGNDPLIGVLERERQSQLYRCMLQLPEQYRQVLELHYLEAMGVQEVGRILGKNSKQVYNLLARARVALKDILEREGVTYENL